MSPVKDELSEILDQLRAHVKTADQAAVAVELLRAKEYRESMSRGISFDL